MIKTLVNFPLIWLCVKHWLREIIVDVRWMRFQNGIILRDAGIIPELNTKQESEPAIRRCHWDRASLIKISVLPFRATEARPFSSRVRVWFLFAVTYITALCLAVPLAREKGNVSTQKHGRKVRVSTHPWGVFPAYEGADTFRHGREETPPRFIRSLSISLSLTEHPDGNFLVPSMRVIVKIRAGAAELSLIISERLDPRIRLLLVIQFTRDAIINGELISFRTAVLHMFNLVRIISSKNFIRW